MVIAKLMGGLGNQMFQYALSRRVSILRKTDVKADVSFLNDKNFTHTAREFELDIFSSDIQVAAEAELNKFIAIQKSKVKRRIQRILPFISSYHIIAESTYQYNANILNSPRNSLLIGYWQTEKYFLPIQDIIRKDFTFKKPLTGLNKTLSDSIKSNTSVSIHIRRGDYINNAQMNKFHGSCTPEYYYAALRLVKEKIDNIQLYIFSDDIAWIKSNMTFDVPVTYIDNNTGRDSYIDMQLMSLCKHNIIANSSFSWWGAWLNNNPAKIVVAPKKWFNDNSVNVNDIIPEGWHKL